MKKINKEELAEIKEFIKVVSQDQTVNLNNFNNNLKTLKVYEMTYEELKEEIAVSGDAAYEYIKNEIYITNKSKDLKSIYHELFHLASTKKNDNIVYNGYLCCNLDTEEYKGRGLNEGYTELLSDRFFKTGTDYYYERIWVSQLEQIIGEKFLKDNYFNPNLDAIINKLGEYSSKDEATEFIRNFDKYTYLTTLSKEGSKDELQDIVDNCCSYLFYAFSNKLQNDNKVQDKMSEFNKFLNGFHFGYILNDNYGKISMYESMKKIGDSTGLFTLDDEKAKNL